MTPDRPLDNSDSAQPSFVEGITRVTYDGSKGTTAEMAFQTTPTKDLVDLDTKVRRDAGAQPGAHADSGTSSGVAKHSTMHIDPRCLGYPLSTAAARLNADVTVTQPFTNPCYVAPTPHQQQHNAFVQRNPWYCKVTPPKEALRDTHKGLTFSNRLHLGSPRRVQVNQQVSHFAESVERQPNFGGTTRTSKPPTSETFSYRPDPTGSLHRHTTRMPTPTENTNASKAIPLYKEAFVSDHKGLIHPVHMGHTACYFPQQLHEATEAQNSVQLDHTYATKGSNTTNTCTLKELPVAAYPYLNTIPQIFPGRLQTKTLRFNPKSLCKSHQQQQHYSEGNKRDMGEFTDDMTDFKDDKSTSGEESCFLSSYVNKQKNYVLDWIAPPEKMECLERPPCPPVTVFCDCSGPTVIEEIPAFNCDTCGSVASICRSCNRYRRCPYCGGPIKPPPASCILECANPSGALKSVVPPKLLVTSIGPFQPVTSELSKPRACAQSLCSDIGVCQMMHETGFQMGVNCFKFWGTTPEPPPAPFPPRPLQQLFPDCFRMRPTERSKFPCSLWNKKKESHTNIPRGGLVGTLEDIAIIALTAATSVTHHLLDVFWLLGKHSLDGQSQSSQCQCSLPLQLYPNENGFYSDPPDHPTRATGCRPLDAVNQFLDAVTLPPNQNAEHTQQEPPIADTQSTGNRFIDTCNTFLDKTFPIAPERQLQQIPQDPYVALRRCLTSRPTTAVQPHNLFNLFLPCLVQNQSAGPCCVSNCIPSGSLGENVSSCRSAPNNIDYVDFDLLSSSKQQDSPDDHGPQTTMLPSMLENSSIPCAQHIVTPTPFTSPIE